MTKSRQLQFNLQIGSQKPESIINRSTACPFCDRDSLTDIIEEQGPIMLLKNKYPVLQDTYPTVLIETDDCDADLTTYDKEHLYRLIRFGVQHWRAMEESGEFTSVMFFKNHGPYSGGSIHHPHMQIIGLNHVDCMEHTHVDHFEGVLIDEQPGVSCNLSTQPRIGFSEFNVVLRDREQIDRMADYIQMLTHYVMNHFHKSCNSYNLFFYRFGDTIKVKVIPRFIVSPVFVGYSIPQVPTNLEHVVRDIQNRYLQREICP
ncbi:DUF4931 domain-containing protein [Brevibacillus dissolubilis]|uniref:DUF4931 domain-containing protein n=1 Tax=Brevibacillus dissolubilis TaxID=1844116 RepID=UPI00111776AE|nr:DUF4931 domain-containing protein [Brevibacillus dissolubilis]